MSRQANERIDNPEIDSAAHGNSGGDKDARIVEETGTFLRRAVTGQPHARSPRVHPSQDTQRPEHVQDQPAGGGGAAGPRRTTLTVHNGNHSACHRAVRRSEGATETVHTAHRRQRAIGFNLEAAFKSNEKNPIRIRAGAVHEECRRSPIRHGERCSITLTGRTGKEHGRRPDGVPAPCLPPDIPEPGAAAEAAECGRCLV